MRRILHITGGMNRAGAETMIINLYRVINKDKFQFDFLYFTDQICDYDAEIESLGGHIYRIPETNPLKRMKAIQHLLQKNPQWETVHCHMLFSNAFHIYAAYKAGVKQRITHAHNTKDISKKKWIGKLYHFISKKVQAKYATDFVACGVEAGKYLFPKNDEVIIIPNSVDVKALSKIAAESKNHIRNEFNISPKTLILIQVGTFGPQKNYPFTLKIAQELKEQGIDFKLFLAGRGPLRDQIQKEVNRRNLDSKIIFLGVRTDIPQLLGGADLLLMPSLFEGFPVVLVESQASGLPALIADTISKEVDLGVHLIQFESLNNPPNRWVQHLLKTLSEEGLPEKERSDRLKKQGFDIHTNAKELEKLYNSL